MCSTSSPRSTASLARARRPARAGRAARIRRPAVGGEPRDLALALHRRARGLRPRLVRRTDRLARRRWRRRVHGRVALRRRRPHAGDAVRGLRHRGRLRPRARVGGVANEAARRWPPRWAARTTSRERPQVDWRRHGDRLRAFVEELVRAGVREAVVCPGSRSTPLALALAAHGGSCVRVLLDERSAGFFALGHGARPADGRGRCSGRRGPRSSTSCPAVVEASLARVPLIVLTADRPAELRDRGAPQTIDQVGLYGTPRQVVGRAAAARRRARDAGARALAWPGAPWRPPLAGPTGPVHLNLPFREPLVPGGNSGRGRSWRFTVSARRVPASRRARVACRPTSSTGSPSGSRRRRGG